MRKSRSMRVGVAASVVAAGVVGLAPARAAYVLSAQPFVGVTHFRFVQEYDDATTTPQFARPVVMDVMRIDTQAAGIRFEMQGGNGSAPGEITRQTTRSFVDGVGAQVGINVGFYDTAATYGGLYTDLIYTAASKGNVYSTSKGREPLFNVSAANVPKIGIAGPAGSDTFNNGDALYNATGGNQRILNAGVAIDDGSGYTTALNPHSALGLDKDNRYVFLATVDGRQGDYSSGMRTDEMAAVLRDQFGVWNAINVDGGGSTTLVMDDTADGARNARVVNSPSDNSSAIRAGTERVVANSLAVFATPRAGYTPIKEVPRPGLTGVVDVFAHQVVLDDFEGTKGHFASAVTASGSSYHVAATSTSTLDTTRAATGNSSLKVKIDNAGGSPAGMQLRFLSGGGSPAENVTDGRAMGNGGYVGVYLRMDPGNANPLFVSILIDDGTTTGNALERGEFFEVIADGAWHLYQWNLNEDGPWTNFFNGDGVIDGPNTFVDSLYFSGAGSTSGGTNFSGTVWVDGVTYNPDGPIAAAVPEPVGVAGLVMGAAVLAGRRIRRRGGRGGRRGRG